jgi:hypothetical protein
MGTITGPYSQAPNPANCELGRGILYFDEFQQNTAIRTGLQQLGNCTTFDVENKVEIKEKYESMTPASSLYARAVTRQTVNLKITGDEYSIDNIRRSLLGSVELVEAVGAAVAAEAVTSAAGAVLGRYYQLANRNITALTDVKQGVTALVLGTDYTLFDAVRGIIYLLPTSVTITPGDQITADYTYGTYTYNAIAVGTVGTVDGVVLFVGNPVKGPTYEGTWWHASFTPSGQLGFIADDFGNWTLEGMVIADALNHPTDPVGRIIQIA